MTWIAIGLAVTVLLWALIVAALALAGRGADARALARFVPDCVVLVAVFLFHVPFRGSLLALYAICSAFKLPALGQGLLISAGTKNQFLASQLALLSAFWFLERVLEKSWLRGGLG